MTYFLHALAWVLPLFLLGIAILSVISQRQLGKHRGIPREEFIHAFQDAGVSSEIPAALYDYYKSSVFSKEYSVAPDDNYDQVLKEGDEDIDDDLMFIMRDLKLKKPPDYAIKRFETPIRTLRDAVLWLDWVSKQQPGAR